MFRQLREDIAIVKEKDPAARSSLEILLTYSGLKAVRSYRRAHWFYQHKWFTIARIISQRARHKTGKRAVHRPRHGCRDRGNHRDR